MAPTKKAAKAEKAESVAPEHLTQTGGLVPNRVLDAGGGDAVGVTHGALGTAHDGVTGVYVNTPVPAGQVLETAGDPPGVTHGTLPHPHDS